MDERQCRTRDSPCRGTRSLQLELQRGDATFETTHSLPLLNSRSSGRYQNTGLYFKMLQKIVVILFERSAIKSAKDEKYCVAVDWSTVQDANLFDFLQGGQRLLGLLQITPVGILFILRPLGVLSFSEHCTEVHT